MNYLIRKQRGKCIKTTTFYLEQRTVKTMEFDGRSIMKGWGDKKFDSS